MQLKPFLTSLLLTISLPALCAASAIAPIPDNASLSDSSVETKDPLSLKEKLDKARNQALGKTPELVPAAKQQPVTAPSIAWDSAPENVPALVQQDPVQKTITPPAQIVAEPVENQNPIQEVTQYTSIPTYNAPIAPAASSSIQALLFDDEKFSAMATPSAKPYSAMEAIASTPAAPQPITQPPIAASEPVRQAAVAEMPKQAWAPQEIPPAPVPAPIYEPAPVMAAAPVMPPVSEPRPASVPALVETTPFKDDMSPALPPPIRPMVSPVPVIADVPSGKQVASNETPFRETARKFEPTAIPKAIEIRKPRTSRFTPKPTSPVGTWVLRDIAQSSPKKNDAYCILENRFKNNLNMFIAENADGLSNIGINYGIEMLQGSKNYRTEVKIDDSFDESFNAYAESPTTLIVEMGKKPSFFASVVSGDALNVGFPGTASTFSLKGMQAGMDKFAECLNKIGAPPMPSATSVTVPINHEPEMAVVPIPPVATENISAPNETAQPVPVTTAPLVSSANWTERTLSIMEKANISSPYLQRSENDFRWSNGLMKSHVANIGTNDILDSATQLLDKAEKSCAGQFTSQMGIPEDMNGSTILMMESKCAVGNDANVAVWLLESKNQSITVWQMEAPRDQRNMAFASRNALLNAFKQP